MSTLKPRHRIIFTASLLLNLLLLGIIAGQEWRNSHHMPPRGWAREMSALPEPMRGEATQALKRFEKENAALRRALKESRREAARLLAAEPFDKPAYLAQLERMRELRLQLSRRMGENIANLAEKWPAGQRAMLTEIFRRPPCTPSERTDDAARSASTP